MQKLPQHSLSDATTAFLEALAALVRGGARSEATLCMHREHVGWWLSHLNGSSPLASLDESVIDRALNEERRGRRGRAISEATLAKRVSTLRQALALAKRWRWIERVPEMPRIVARSAPRELHLRTPEDLARLLRALPVEHAEWIAVAVFTGQHPSDVERMQAYVDADPFASPAPWMRVRNTKNKRPTRTVVMPSHFARLLREVFRRRELQPGDPIVTPWDKDQRRRDLRRAGRAAGVGYLTATAMRHTCGTWAVHELRAVTKGAADWLGHSSTKMLERVYAHALPAGLAEVSAALDRFVQPHARLLMDSLGVGRSDRRRKGKPPKVLEAPRGAKTSPRAGAPRTGRGGLVRRRPKGV